MSTHDVNTRRVDIASIFQSKIIFQCRHICSLLYTCFGADGAIDRDNSSSD